MGLSMFRKWVGLCALVTGTALVVGSVGCDKKKFDELLGKDTSTADEDDSDSDSDDDDGKKSSASSSSSASGTPVGKVGVPPGPAPPVSGPPSGQLIKFMPADCPAGRVYLNTAQLVGDPNAQTALRRIAVALAAKTTSEKGKKALGMLKDAGFDLATSIREFAMCMGKVDDDHAMGIAVAMREQPLDVLIKLASMGGATPKIENRGSVKFIGTKTAKVAFAQMAPGILVLGPRARLESGALGAGAAGFSGARSRVAYGFLPIPKGGNIEARIIDDGSKFEVWAAMQPDAATAAKMKQNPDAFLQGMEQEIKKATAEFIGTPFEIIHQRVQQMRFSIEGDRAIASGALPKSDIAKLLSAAAGNVGVAPPPPGQPQPPPTGPGPASGGADIDELLKLLEQG